MTLHSLQSIPISSDVKPIYLQTFLTTCSKHNYSLRTDISPRSTIFGQIIMNLNYYTYHIFTDGCLDSHFRVRINLQAKAKFQRQSHTWTRKTRNRTTVEEEAPGSRKIRQKLSRNTAVEEEHSKFSRKSLDTSHLTAVKKEKE